MGATSFISAPCPGGNTVTGRGMSMYVGKPEKEGTLWLRENSTGRLTFVRACPKCGGKHHLNNENRSI
jgi:hypothetical protein